MTDTEYTPIPADELDAIEARREQAVQGFWEDYGLLECKEPVGLLITKDIPRLLAEAREAQRLRENSAIAQHTGKVLLKAAQDEIAQLTARVEALKRYEDFYNNNQAYLDQAAWEANGGVPAISWAEALQKTNNQLQARVAELIEALEEAIAQRDSCGVGFMRPDRPAIALTKAKGGGV